MHPNRWAWCLEALDSSGRPVILADDNGLVNAAGISTGGDAAAQGVVGSILNVPVVTDNQIPVNGGAGTNQDSVIVGRFPDAWFWEDNVKAEAFPATFASNLSLFLRLYSYIALQPARYPKSFSVISGTGLVAPVL
jgi:hypothetical protein